MKGSLEIKELMCDFWDRHADLSFAFTDYSKSEVQAENLVHVIEYSGKSTEYPEVFVVFFWYLEASGKNRLQIKTVERLDIRVADVFRRIVTGSDLKILERG